MTRKTLYIWDLANTLFPEHWNSKLSGFGSYDDYVKSLGYDLNTISPHDYEWSYEQPYKEGLFELNVADGFREVLSSTKNNAVFTTGNKEQIDWRAEQLNKKYDFDIRDYVKEIYSTLDYGNTNKKTQAMLEDILKKKYKEGFTTVVYTDDNLDNCLFFIKAAKGFTQQAPDFNFRVYSIRNDNKGVRPKDGYFEIGNLYDLKKNEEKIIYEKR